MRNYSFYRDKVRVKYQGLWKWVSGKAILFSMLILILIFLIYYIWMFKNQVRNVSSSRFKRHVKQTNKQTNKQKNKQKRIIPTYKNEFLGTYIHLKSSIKQSMYQQVKILQNSCFATFGSSTCHGNLSWHVQLLHPPKPQIPKNWRKGSNHKNKCYTK